MNHNDDFETDFMSDEQDDQVEEFFNVNNFVKAPGVNHSGSNFECVWEDFKEAEAFHKANPDYHVYTAIGDEDLCHIVPGKHLVNRYGYLFTKDDTGMKQDDQLRIR